MPEEEMLDPSNQTPVDYVEERIRELSESEQIDFDAWTSLITQVEKSAPNDIQKICVVYDSFLSEFPLCYGYWKKYADHMARLCAFKVEEVYERAVKTAAYSVDLWVCYCSYAEMLYEPADIRRLYERGFSFVGKDYLCYVLWDKYIKFEYSQKQWSQLAHIYINILKFPTKKLHHYYERFKNLVAVLLEEMGSQDNTEIKSDTIDIAFSTEIADTKTCGYAELSNIVRNIFDEQEGPCRPSSVKKYLAVGELLYEKSSQLDQKICVFETRIKRPYFHPRPLDDCQLQNWHCYLDFVEMQGDFDWAVKLYERCLIPCANYSEFWIRYAEFVEPRCGREIAKYAISRALAVYLKKVPAFHVYSAMFMEQVGDVGGARSSSLACHDNSVPNLIENVNRRANREKRLGDIGSACRIYMDAIEMAKEKQNTELLSALYCNFARFTFAISGSIDEANKVFIMGINQAPCKLIIEGLLRFVTLHGGKEHIAMLDSIVSTAISPASDISRALSSHDREDISNFFFEFVDLYGSINEIRMAWDRHRRLFPHTMRPLPSTTTISSATFKNIPLDNRLVGRNGISTAFFSDSGIDSHDSAVLPVGNVPPRKNNDSATENMPFGSNTQESHGSLVDSSLNDRGDNNEHEAAVHATDNPTLVDDAVILCEENKNVLKGTKELVDDAAILCEENKNVLKGTKEREELELGDVLEKQSKVEESALHDEVDELIYESHYVVQTPQAPSEYAEIEKSVHRIPELELEHDTRVTSPALDNLLINSQDNECQEVDLSIHESDYVVQTSQVPSECAKSESPLHMFTDLEPGAGLSPPALDNASIFSPENGNQEFSKIVSPHNISHEVVSNSDADKFELKGDCQSSEVEEKHLSSLVRVGSGSPQDKHKKDSIPLIPDGDQTSPGTPRNKKLQVQVQEETDVQLALPEDRDPQNVSIAGSFSQKHSGGHAPDDCSAIHRDCVQPLETQQYQVSTDLQSETSSQMIIVQAATNVQQALPVDDQQPQNASTVGSISQKYYGGQASDCSGVTYHGIVQPSQTQQYQAPTDMQSANSRILISQGQIYQPQAWTNTQDQQVNQIQGQFSVPAAQLYPLPAHSIPQAVVYGQPIPSTQPASQPQSQVYQNTLQSNGQYGYVQTGQAVQPHIWQYYQQLYYLQQQQNQQIHGQPQQQWQTEQLQQLQQKLAQQQQSQDQHYLNQLQQKQENQQLNNQEQQQQLSPYQGQSQQQNQLLFQQWNQQVIPTQHQLNQSVDPTQQQQYILYQQQQQMYLQQQQQQQLYMQQQQQVQMLQQQLLQQQQQQQLQQQQLLQHHQHLPQQQQSSASNSSSYVQGEGDVLQNNEQSRSSQTPTPQKTPQNR